MKRLSIIVPIYNVEPYIERCIRSLEDQDIPLDEYEIICINDGSSDKSRLVVMKLQEEFKNIRLINQENQGVSVARNNGIDQATGEYLIMVDADDYILPNILKERLDICEKNDLDVGLAGYIILNEALQEEYRYDPFYDSNYILTGIEYFNKYERGKSEIRDPHRSVAIFFKASFLNLHNLRYMAGVPYLEDGELMSRIVCLASRVSFINGPIYIRTSISGSATQSRLYYTEKARNGFLKAANNLLQFKDSYCTNEKHKVFMNQSILHFLINYLVSIEELKYLQYYPELYDNLKKGPLTKLDTEGCSDFYRKLGNSYNFSLHLFYLHWIFLKIIKSLKIRFSKI